MYFITITNWRRKLIYVISLILIIALVAFIVPLILGFNTAQTESQVKDDEILTQPIKVQSTPKLNNSSEIKLQK